MTIVELWQAYWQERSVAVAETSQAHGYLQVQKWLERCPIQDPEKGRLILLWLLQQEPKKSALRIAFYLKTLYRWASQDDVALVQRNYVASFKLPKAPQTPDPTVIPEDLVPEVLVALRQSSSRSRFGHRWDLLAGFMLQTGLRTCEAFGLSWSDINWETREATVHQNMTITHGLSPRTKTGRPRQVPLNATAIKILTEVRQLSGEGELIFPWSRKSFMTTFRNSMARLVRDGVTPTRFRPYDLRHTNISALLERGIPVTQVAQWAGNSAQMIWHHYAGTTKSYEMPDL
jgi:integrase